MLPCYWYVVARLPKMPKKESKCSIYNVRYTSTDRKYISHVWAQVCYDDGSHDGQREYTKAAIIKMYDNGCAVKTRINIERDDCEDGADVTVVTVENERYLKTKANKVKEDNLGKLPIF